MTPVNASTLAANRASLPSAQDIAGPHAGTQAFSYDLAQPPSARLRDSVRLIPGVLRSLERWLGVELTYTGSQRLPRARPGQRSAPHKLTCFVSPTCRLLSAMFEGLRDRGVRCRTACIVTSTSSCKGAWSAARPTWGSLRL